MTSHLDFLAKELETAESEYRRYRKEYLGKEYLAGSVSRQKAKTERDYWAGYADAITNAINNEKGMTTE